MTDISLDISFVRRLCGIAILATIYIGAATVDFSIYDPRGALSMIWLPTGIALGSVLVYGAWLWPGIAIGAFVTVATRFHHPFAGLWIAIIATAEALVASFLLRRVIHMHTALGRVRDVLALVAIALVTTFAGSTLGVVALHLVGVLPEGRFVELWSTWWWGQLSADLIVAPVLLTWGTSAPAYTIARPRRLETIALVLSVVLVGGFVFTWWFPPCFPGPRAPYYVMPLLLWAGLRFGPRGAAAACFGVDLVAIIDTSVGRGPLLALVDLQTFISITSIATLALSAMALERLRAVERKGAIVEGALDAIVTVDDSGAILEFNPAAERLFGFREADVLGKDPTAMLIPASLHEPYRRALREHVNGGAKKLAGTRVRAHARRADGSEFPAEIAFARVQVEGRYLFTGFVRDMTAEHLAERARREARGQLEQKVAERTAELRRANDEIKRNDAMFREAQLLAHLGSFDADLGRGVDTWSDELFRIFGRDPATFAPSYERFLEVTHPDDHDRVRATVEQARRDHRPYNFEFRIVRPDGEVRILQTQANVIEDDRITGCCQDITERKRAEEARDRLVARDITEAKHAETQMRLSLREKDVLLREIHHRVKNNLQVVSSLLNLQVATESSEAARKGLVESQSRIYSMALVHQLLYRSKDLSHIELGEYLNALVSRLAITYNVGPDRIEVLVDVARIRVDIDRAIPCGLIVNELVTNALGHAFPGDRHGHVWVTVTAEDDRIVLVVRDDGVGLPPETHIETVQTFGLQIARLLIEQLDGTIELRSDHGTTVRVELAAGT